MNPALLITFDIEEFDLPAELNRPVAPAQCRRVAEAGAQAVAELCADRLPATCFVTASFARDHGAAVRGLVDAGCEVACHGADHADRYPRFSPAELSTRLQDARALLQDVSGQPVRGHRSPRFSQVDPALLAQAGFGYDSSSHPTWVPGRYNHLTHATAPSRRGGLWEVPVSVMPGLRLPFSWIWFRNQPEALSRLAGALSLRRRGVVCSYFHNWEFVDLRSLGADLPRPISRHTGRPLAQRLQRFIDALAARGATPSTVSCYLEQLAAS